MNDLRTARDSLQTEANDNVLVETSGLDEALRVRHTSQQFQPSKGPSVGNGGRKRVPHGSI
jgi:hypothetical protein